MIQGGTVYPDISDILARKEQRRRAIRRLSFGEKIALVEKMRERLAPFKRHREARRAADQTEPELPRPCKLMVSESAESGCSHPISRLTLRGPLQKPA
jgi:hypothetical protein